VLGPAAVSIDPVKRVAGGFGSLKDALEAVYTNYKVCF